MFEIKNEFFIDGKPVKLFSGAIHYFRVLPEQWEDRLSKLKAAGFNAVETYMCWNLHEPKESEFDFSGRVDVAKFVETAGKLGLYAIVRPGPYICAEWDFGGFPAWLLNYGDMKFRCNDKLYMQKVERYIKKAMSELAPLQIDKGGNLIAFQVENEYGSYGNDKEYLARLEKLMRDCGITVPFFTSDGPNKDMLSGGTLPHIFKTVNFGSGAAWAYNYLDKIQPDKPRMCMEFWCGWFDHYGEKHHTRPTLSVTTEIEKLIEKGSFNIYMFHGGTNFGFTAGANYGKAYQPTVTSYDYAAPLNEYGDYTPTYYKIREILLDAQGLSKDTPLPPRPQLQNVGTVELKEKGDLWKNLYVLGEKHVCAAPEYMENLGQNFGYILYRKTIKGDYGAHKLLLEGVRDIAYVRVDGKPVAKYDRMKNGAKKHNDGFEVKLSPFNGEITVEILVEGMGRVNYGPEIASERKGLKKVRLDYQEMFGWEIYTLPFDNLEKTVYDGAPDGAPAILKGKFTAEKGKDCFVDMKGFTKGFVVVNGFNLGRYWAKGPQRSLYIPAPIVKEKNEIIVVEQEGRKTSAVIVSDKHCL